MERADYSKGSKKAKALTPADCYPSMTTHADHRVWQGKKLQLDQREAAETFGGNVNAFSRYENDKNKPSLALVKLLKVFERHPDLLNEVRAT